MHRYNYCVRGEDSVLVIDIDRATPEIFYSKSDLGVRKIKETSK